MMEFLLSLLQDLLKIAFTVLVTAYMNKLVSNFSKKHKKTTRQPSKRGRSSKKLK